MKKMGIFDSTGSTDHVHTLNNQKWDYKGYKVWVTCLDPVRMNIASSSNDFFVIQDTNAPVIARAYKGTSTYADMLYLGTNEPATCQYSLKSFIYGKGTDMDTELSFNHAIEWKSETVYVTCKDRYDNIGSAVPVHPFTISESTA